MTKTKLTANILFSGIGCQEIGIMATGRHNLEVVATSEIDKEAVIAYAAIHNGLTPKMVKAYKRYPDTGSMVEELEAKHIGFNPKTKKEYNWRRQKRELVRKTWLAVKLSHNLGDIERIKKLPYADVWTVSFPCTDISRAGKREGFAQGSKTRSSLLWVQVKLLETSVKDNEAPVIIMFENVKDLVQEEFRPGFDKLLSDLSSLGYNSYWKILSAKDYGTPQSRERVFVYCIRKDADKGTYKFPEPVAFTRSLDDILLPGHTPGAPAGKPAASITHNFPTSKKGITDINIYLPGTTDGCTSTIPAGLSPLC